MSPDNIARFLMRLSLMKFASSVRSVAKPAHVSTPSWAGSIQGEVLTQRMSGKPASRAAINSCLNQAFCAEPSRDLAADSAAAATAEALCKSLMITRTRPTVKAWAIVPPVTLIG